MTRQSWRYQAMHTTVVSGLSIVEVAVVGGTVVQQVEHGKGILKSWIMLHIIQKGPANSGISRLTRGAFIRSSISLQTRRCSTSQRGPQFEPQQRRTTIFCESLSHWTSETPSPSLARLEKTWYKHNLSLRKSNRRIGNGPEHRQVSHVSLHASDARVYLWWYCLDGQLP